LDSKLELRLRKCSTLPTLSAVAIEVLQRCRDEDLDFNEIARIIGRDPALSIKVLKMANSPLFGLRYEVRTIGQALGILGLNSVRTLVLSFSLVRDSAQERNGPLAACWKRSVISSIAARELCALQNKALQEEAYLAGLLQDVGIMALARAFSGQYEQLHLQPDLTHDGLRAAEQAVFGADHAEVGAWLLERWGVSAQIAQLVKHSHDSRQISAEDADLHFLAKCVEYSGRLADLWSSTEASAAIHLAESEAAALFGEGTVDIVALGGRILEAVAAVAPLFELEVDNDEMTMVLEQAQEAMASSVVRLEAATQTLQSQARRDALTGLYNRGSLDAHLRRRFEASQLDRLAVLFADIDYFKKINDTYGHAAGDAVLRSVAQRLSSSARSGDFVARYGGEEFMVVLDLKNPEELPLVAERIRAAIEQPPHSLGAGQSLPVTISIGCAAARPGQHTAVEGLLGEADQALYSAKRSGRNRVVQAPLVPQPGPLTLALSAEPEVPVQAGLVAG
jgi:diguanylate cyclase (GGDEF)-like protein